MRRARFSYLLLGGMLALALWAGTAQAATTVGSNISTGGTLTVVGASTVAAVTSTIVTSSLYLSVGSIPANSNASFANGSANISGRLSVDGATYVSSTMNVTGNTRFYGTLVADTSVSSTMVTSSLHLGVGVIDGSNASWSVGDVNVGGRLSVDGAVYMSSTLAVSSAVTFYSTVNTLSTTTISLPIIPASNAGTDLGFYGSAFRDVYVSSSLTIGGGSGVSSTAIRAHISTISASIDFLSQASTTMKCTDTQSGNSNSDVTVAGAGLGDTVVVAPTIWDAAFASGTLQALVQSANTVRIIYCGAPQIGDAGDRDPAAQSYRVDVWKH